MRRIGGAELSIDSISSVIARSEATKQSRSHKSKNGLLRRKSSSQLCKFTNSLIDLVDSWTRQSPLVFFRQWPDEAYSCYNKRRIRTVHWRSDQGCRRSRPR